jgi:alkylhydroperoxidase family enzyme
MARLPYLEKADLAPEDQALLARDINLHKILAHNPAAARAFGTLGQYLRHGTTLDARLRELVILQVGWQARSPYEWSHHVKIGRDFGVTDADIAGLIAESRGEASGLEPLARLCLRAARELHDGAIGPATFAELAGQLDPASLTDLVVTASFYCAVVRLLASFEIDVEPGYRPYLEAFPLPAG